MMLIEIKQHFPFVFLNIEVNTIQTYFYQKKFYDPKIIIIGLHIFSKKFYPFVAIRMPIQIIGAILKN